MSDDGLKQAASVIDWAAARRLAGEDDDLLAELVEMFPEESARHLAAIRAAIAQEDAEVLTRAAHTLKSSSRLFGAEALANHALDIEILGRDGLVAKAGERLRELEAELAKVIAALREGPLDAEPEQPS